MSLLTRHQLQALYVCLEHAKKNGDPEKNEFCVRWLRPRYLELFGEDLTQRQFMELAELGYLKKGDLNHGGNRRWYTISDVRKVEQSLQGFKLPALA